MRSIYAKFKNYVLLRAILCLALGVLLFVHPTFIPQLMLNILSGYFIVMGILSIVSYFRNQEEGERMQFNFISGILLVMLGIILAAASTQIANIIHLFLGLMVTMSGANYFAQSREIHKNAPPAGLPLLVYSIVVMAVGVLIVFNPFAAQVILFQVFGVVLSVMGISDILCLIVYRKK